MYLDTAKWKQAFAELCPEINSLLDIELKAGNKLSGIYRAGQDEMAGWLPSGTIIVHVEMAFFTPSYSLPAEINPGGPDYQCGIYHFYQCSLHHHMLMESRIG